MAQPAQDLDDLSWVDELSPQEAAATLAALGPIREKREQTESLPEFFKAAWEILEPGKELLWNWHMDTVCGYLEAVHYRIIRRLLINIPPGTAKSLMANVIYPAWVWTTEPSHRFLCGSNADTLATRDSLKMRSLITSEWYQDNWGEHVQPNPQQWEKTLFQNKKYGHRESQGVLGKVTGKRGDTLIWDDPHDTKTTESDLVRQQVLDAWDYGWSNRLNDPNTSASIIIMQRIHTEDITGYILSKKKEQDWKQLCIPMEYEEGSELAFDAGDDIKQPHLNDPRTKEGELLMPSRFNAKTVEDSKVDLGPYGAAGQLQQRPAPRGGGEFKEDWLNHYKIRPTKIPCAILVDPAGERKPGVTGKRDNTAMVVVGLNSDNNYYLLDAVRDRLNLTERTDILFEWHRRYKPKVVGYEQYGMQSDIAHIQDKMEDRQHRFKIVELGGAMRKEDRIRRLIPLLAENRLWLPALGMLLRTNSDGQTRDVIEDFIEIEYKAFPVAKWDDLFDVISRLMEDEILTKLKKPMNDMNQFYIPTPGMTDPGVGY
jgi:phage terminase large subunit-like protein